MIKNEKGVKKHEIPEKFLEQVYKKEAFRLIVQYFSDIFLFLLKRLFLGEISVSSWLVPHVETLHPSYSLH